MGNETNVQEWAQPLISIDVVPLQYDKKHKTLRVLLGKRKYEPFLGDIALPGVLLLPSERVAEAATRALMSKVHISTPDSIKLLQDIGVSDNPDRDPRGATLSIILLALLDEHYASNVNDDTVQWHDVTNLDSVVLPFDHTNLIRKALIEVERAFFVDVSLTKALLGEVFSTSDVATVYRILTSTTNSGLKELNKTNLARKIRLSGLVKEISVKSTTVPVSSATLFSSSEEKIKINTRGRGRPSVSWTWA